MTNLKALAISVTNVDHDSIDDITRATMNMITSSVTMIDMIISVMVVVDVDMIVLVLTVTA